MEKFRQKYLSRSPSVIDRMGAVLFDSEAAFRAMIHEKASLLQAMIVMFSIAFLTGGLQMIHLDRVFRWLLIALQPPYSNLNTIIPDLVDVLHEIQLGYPSPPLIGAIIIGASIGSAILYSFFMWFIWASVAHLLAKMFFRGTGTWRNDLVLFAYSSIVDVVGLFVMLILLVVHPLAALIALLVVPLIVLPWKVMMAVQAIKENHGIGTAHAFYCVFLIPLGIPLLIILIGVATMFSVAVWPI